MVEKMRNSGHLPDLIEGTHEFNILITVPGHPNNHPKLLML